MPLGPDDPAATRERHEAWLKEIFLSSLPSTAAADYLRAVVERDAWFVPLRADGALDVIDAKRGKHRLAIDPEPERHTSERKGGRGGRLLPVYAERPELRTTLLDGRALARALPGDIDALLVRGPDARARELGREHFDALRELADAVDLEDMLAAPAAGQVERLLRATWHVAMRGDRLHLQADGDGALAVAATHPARVGYLSDGGVRAVGMEGARLFRLVVDTEAADGLLVNPTSTTGRGDARLNRLVLPVAFADCIARGEDIRPGAHPLPVRSRAEVELWLRLRGFPWEGRELVEAPLPDVILVRAWVPRGGGWRAQETLGAQREIEGRTWSPVFALPHGAADAAGLGEGPSRIVCPGLLARALGADRFDGAEPRRAWRPGRWLVAGRRLAPRDIARSRERLALATELLKLLPAGADRVPRTAMLTVRGAALARAHPHAVSRDWIVATAERAARYARPWVWGPGA